MHVDVKDLSPAVRRALESVGYGARDIRVEASASVEAHVAGGDGMRGFVVILNLDTGAMSRVNGAWGGAAIAAPHSPVDLGAERIELPPNGAVLKGTTGYPRTFATIYAHPEAFGRMLPSAEPADELTDADQQALYCFAAIKGGEYRREEMARRGVSAETVDALVDRGYLKRNRAGATAITTKGKNARTLQR